MSRPICLALAIVLGLSIPSASAQDKLFLSRPMSDWTLMLRSTDAKQRRSAAFALGKIGNRALHALPAMKAAYAKDSDLKVKEALVYAMGEICREALGAAADAELEPFFIGALADADPHVRRSAVFALGCLATKSPKSRQALETALGDREAIVRQNAAWAVGQHGLDALPLLRTALRDTDSLVKRDAAIAMLYMGSEEKVHERVRALLKDLLPLCRDDNSEVRRAALNVLVRIVDAKDREAIPPLRTAMEDRDLENRRNAALALSNIGGEETAIAVPILLEAIQNGDTELRRQATLAIRNIGPAAAKAVPQMARLLSDDPDATTREYAAFALGDIGKASASATPVLVKKIQDTNEKVDVRTQCAKSLNRIGPGPAADAAAADLLAVLGNPKQDARVREYVVWSLRVHRENLRKMNGPKDVLSRILKEQMPPENRMFRYDCAYMLGVIWQKDAPDIALDVLNEFLQDDKIQIFDRVDSGVGGAGEEIKGGAATVKVRLKGDGRVMAADALQAVGPDRYAGRLDIMKHLRALAADPKIDETLRKKVAALVKAAP